MVKYKMTFSLLQFCLLVTFSPFPLFFAFHFVVASCCRSSFRDHALHFVVASSRLLASAAPNSRRIAEHNNTGKLHFPSAFFVPRGLEPHKQKPQLLAVLHSSIQTRLPLLPHSAPWCPRDRAATTTASDAVVLSSGQAGRLVVFPDSILGSLWAGKAVG